MSRDWELREHLNDKLMGYKGSKNDKSKDVVQKIVRDFIEMENMAQIAYRCHGDSFTTTSWHCCQKLCFASIVFDLLQVRVVDELILIYSHANH